MIYNRAIGTSLVYPAIAGPLLSNKLFVFTIYYKITREYNGSLYYSIDTISIDTYARALTKLTSSLTVKQTALNFAKLLI